MNSEKILDISWSTIFKIGLGILIFYIIYLIKEILIWFVLALIIAILFEPAIDFLEKKKVPRILAIFFVYLLFLGILGLSIYLVVPVFVSEIQQFSQLFSQYFEKLTPPLKQLGFTTFKNLEDFNKTLQEWLIKISTNIFSAISAVFGGILATFTIFTISVFISLEEKGIEKTLLFFTPKKYEDQVLVLLEKTQKKVAGWFGTRILSCFFIGLATFITLKLFKINYPISFSLFAGVLDIIPIFGPIFAGVVITTITFLDSWFKALFFLVAFILIQQIEGNILIPLLTKKFVGLPPVLVLMAVLIGGKLLGILGAILAIPFFGILFEFGRDFLKKKKEEEIIKTPPPKKTIIW